MPVRIPKARSGEIFCFGAAGVGAFAPLYMMLPGAEERLAAPDRPLGATVGAKHHLLRVSRRAWHPARVPSYREDRPED